jgi:serine protease Do
MRMEKVPTVPLSKASYTAGVTVRRLLVAAGFAGAFAALSGDALAGPQPQPKNQSVPPDAARGAAQAARAVAETADAVADADIHPDENAKSPLDRARQGVVLLERQGKPIGLGTVLKGDGRILTALSSLGHGNNIDARFADGSVSQVRVGHSDRAWDLALLIPQNGRWQQGLRASRRALTDAGSSLHAFNVVGNKQLMLSRTLVKGTRTLVGGDAELLRDAVELTTQVKPGDVGSPILDATGDVMAIVARACAPLKEGSCTQVPFGVPVTAVKAFLQNVPANAVPPAPWLGIQGAAEDTGVVRGVRVLGVHPKSPAAAAGLKGGSDKSGADLVVAVNHVPVTTPEQLATQIGGHSVGDTVELLLFGGGKYRQVSVALRPSPNEKTAEKPPAAAAVKAAPKPATGTKPR